MKKTEFLDRVKHNAKYASAVSTVGVASLIALPVGAADASDIVAKMIGYVLQIFQYIGFLLLAWGIAQLVLAFKNEDADSKSRAMMVLVTAIILTTIKPIIKAIIAQVDPTMGSKI